MLREDTPHLRSCGYYRLVRLLGVGGFAEVYLGEHRYLHTQAAIKMLRLALERRYGVLFRTEAQTIATLKHPHIVRLLDYGIERARPYLVMEYAPGGTLRDRHPAGAQLAPQLVSTYVRQLAEALQYAHDKALIHRDLKPDNVLVGAEGELLLSDFGLAMVQRSRTQSAHSSHTLETMAGTVAYMAPEQIEGKPHPASDQYALAVMAYEWLCGVRPFAGETIAAVVYQHLHEQPPAFFQSVDNKNVRDVEGVRNSGTLAALETVVLRALAKQPDERYPSITAFAHAFARVVQHPPTAQIPRRSFHTFSAPAYPTQHLAPPLRSSVGSVDLPTLYVSQEWPRRASSAVGQPASSLRRRTSESAQMSRVSRARRAFFREGYRSLQHTQEAATEGQAGALITRRGIVLTTLLLLMGTGGGVALAMLDGQFAQTVTVPQSSLHPMSQVTASVNGTAPQASPQARPQTSASTASPTASQATPRSTVPAEALPAPGTTLLTYRGQQGPVFALASSPDGMHIASGGQDTTVQLWDATTGQTLLVYRDHSASVQDLSWSPDGTRLASASADTTVQIWHVVTGQRLLTYRGHSTAVGCVAFSPDGTQVASAGFDKTVQVWNAATGTQLLTYKSHAQSVTSIAWSPDGTRIATTEGDTHVYLWDATTGQTQLIYRGHRATPVAVAWSPTGTMLVSAGSDQTAQLWWADLGTSLLIYHTTGQPLNAVIFSPDGNSLALAGENAASVVSLPNGKAVLTYQQQHGLLSRIVWSSENRWIATSSYDGTVAIWVS